MARYTHELMECDPEALGWGIVGAVLLPADRRMIESLAPQDGLYTLIEREGAEEHVRVIGSLARVVFAGQREPVACVSGSRRFDRDYLAGFCSLGCLERRGLRGCC